MTRVVGIAAGLSVLIHTALAAASPPANRHQENIAKFAIVIGKNEPEDTGQATLRYADDDAVSIHRLFMEANIESILLTAPDEDTKALHRVDGAEKPTLDALLRAFDKVSASI